jgi:hypothetical protein
MYIKGISSSALTCTLGGPAPVPGSSQTVQREVLIENLKQGEESGREETVAARSRIRWLIYMNMKRIGSSRR